MPLTPEQQQNLITRLNKVWVNPKNCLVCNHNEWQIADSVFELREFQGGNLVLGNSKITPIIPVICDNCGNTVFMNAIKLGVINNEDQTNV